MKKLITVIACVALLSACAKKRGDVVESSSDFIIIHGKTYKLMKVVPSDGDRAIWIMYPKDSTDSQPTVVNYEVSQGKSSKNETIIKVD